MSHGFVFLQVQVLRRLLPRWKLLLLQLRRKVLKKLLKRSLKLNKKSLNRSHTLSKLKRKILLLKNLSKSFQQ